MFNLRIGLLGTLFVCGSAFAQQSGEAPPGAQPSADAAALIRQLGDENYAVRQQAYSRLREMGKAALPALHEAEKSSDSEIHERVEDLLSDLQAPQIPRDLPEAPVHGNSGFNGSFVRSENRGGTQTVDAFENGRSIHIERSNRGVRMTVHG